MGMQQSPYILRQSNIGKLPFQGQAIYFLMALFYFRRLPAKCHIMQNATRIFDEMAHIYRKIFTRAI